MREEIFLPPKKDRKNIILTKNREIPMTKKFLNNKEK